MKKWVALFFICFISSISPQTTVSPQFSELKGMEDQQGNTHLFYRIYLFQPGGTPYGNYFENCVYHLETNSNIDTLFIYHGGYISSYGSYYLQIDDYEFWENDFRKFVIAATTVDTEPSPVVFRYDKSEPIFAPWQMWGAWSKNVEISNQDSNNILVQFGDVTFQSMNWGEDWDTLSTTSELLSVSKYSDNVIFAQSELSLLKSTNSGNTFYSVDTGKIYSPNFIYDNDGTHIYALNNRYGSHLIVSNNQGEQFSWETKYSSNSKIFISNDESISGTIYLADKKNILVSTDFGDNFTLYKTLDRKIVGIYKKPNSNKLYAATKYKTYEITPDTIQVIKSLPVPGEVLNLFPLSIGNYWVYSVYTSEGGNNIYWGDETRKVVDIPTSNTGWEVFVYQSKFLNGDIDTTYLILDSLSGRIFASSTGYEDYLLFEDLLAEAGDTVCYEFNPVWNCQFVQPDSQFTEFGLNTSIKRYFSQAPGWYFGHSLVKGIGLYEVYNGDLTTYQSILKGCIIDGVVYGDTITVGVENKGETIVNEFKLEQNYPNPFNPSTNIKFTIPSVALRQAQSGILVTLKVYDILGNEIAIIVNEEKLAGEYEVTLDSHSGEVRNMTSGIYFYQLKAGSFLQTKKMVLLK